MFLYKKRKEISCEPFLLVLFFLLFVLIFVGIYKYFKIPLKYFYYTEIFLIIVFSIVKISHYIYNKRSEKNQKEIKNI